MRNGWFLSITKERQILFCTGESLYRFYLGYIGPRWTFSLLIGGMFQFSPRLGRTMRVKI